MEDAQPTTLTALGKTIPVVLFDGECTFCNRAVQFVFAHDASGTIHFGALQSAEGIALLASALPAGASFPFGTMVYLADGKLLTKAEAALAIAQRMGGAYRLLSYVVAALPLELLNRLYDAFAARRYRWFGRQTYCARPSEAMRARLI